MAKTVLKVGDTVILPYTQSKTAVIVKEDVVKVIRYLVEKTDGARVWWTEKQLLVNQIEDQEEDFDAAADAVEDVALNAVNG